MIKIRLFFARQRDRFCSPDRTHDRGGGCKSKNFWTNTPPVNHPNNNTYPLYQALCMAHQALVFQISSRKSEGQSNFTHVEVGPNPTPPPFFKRRSGGGSRSEVGGVQPSQPPGKSDPELSTKLTARQIVLHADK